MAKITCVIGGAGFIGSHIVRALLGEEAGSRVVVFDNFSSGRLEHLRSVRGNRRLRIERGDAGNPSALARALRGSNTVYHLASNPDVSRAAREPAVDFDQGTLLTHNVLEAMRKTGAREILYASGSGVYGDAGRKALSEDAPLEPISTYGASKLAGEALLRAYAHLFGFKAVAFRFANVVGPHQTHGVGRDFILRLLKNPRSLTVLGDGRQEKSYLHVSDAVSAMRLAQRKLSKGFYCFNVAGPDRMTVTRIARMAAEVAGLRGVRLLYTGGGRGWKGDVPVVVLRSRRIRSLGWRCRHSSEQAMRHSLEAMLEELGP